MCTICEQIFQHEDYLNLHMRHQHTTWKCSYCSKEFPYSRNLRDHQNEAHADLRHISCTKCDEKFFKREHLNQHTKQFHIPVTCELCAEPFSCRSDMTRHRLAEHPKEPIHKCTVCDFRASRKRTIHTHHFRKHGIGKGRYLVY